MIIEQAIYGEVKGGHGLRASSGDFELAIELTSRLDLPDNAPPGADWSPFVSGFPYRDWYVIARTFRDPHAGRAGMVLSHALIAPIDAFVTIPDLRPIFEQLITGPTMPTDLSALSIDPSDALPPAVSELPATAAALVTRSAIGPVIRVGHQGFEPLVASLWGQLWPALRRGFSFRLSFGPGDLVEVPQPALVCTPVSLVGRWQGHRLLDRFVSDAASLVSGILSGNEAGESVRAFTEMIGAEPSTFSELSLLAQAYRLAVLEPNSIGNAIASVRLAERLSPDPSRGDVGKDHLLNNLILLLETATPSDILQLRNLLLHGFAQSERVWRALVRRVADNPFMVSEDPAFRNVVTDALKADSAGEEWRRAVLNGLLGAARKSEKAFPAALWRWAEADPMLTEPLWSHLAVSEPLEERLVQLAPLQLSHEAVKPILAYAAKKRLYRLHGASAAAAYTPIEAIRLHVNVEPMPANDGVRIALKRATPVQIVACAIDVGDPRLVAIAAEAVAEKPELLAKIDMSKGLARSIWSAALENGPDAWHGPADPRKAFDQVLADFINDVEVPLELIGHLANTPLGDLNAFPQRAQLWAKLGAPTRDRLLHATGAAWLQNAEDGRVLSSVEPALCDAILGDRKLDTLLERFASDRLAQAVQLVAALAEFDEIRFRRWLGTVADRKYLIPQTDAEVLGRLAAERRWQGVVDDLLRMLRRGRNDVRPALRACISLVSYLDRWLNNLSHVTAIEKWDSLVDLAAQLYPSGPDYNGLWERAGGEDADLGWGGNGRSRWREALWQIRRGGRPHIEGLLREMQKDYEANIELRYLADDREFGGHR